MLDDGEEDRREETTKRREGNAQLILPRLVTNPPNLDRGLRPQRRKRISGLGERRNELRGNGERRGVD